VHPWQDVRGRPGRRERLKKATGLFAKAADLGNAQAQQVPGSALMMGEGVEKNM